MKMKIPPQVFLYGILAIAVIFVLYFVLKRFGIIKSFQEHKTDKQKSIAERASEISVAKEKAVSKDVKNIVSKTTYFKPTYYKNSGSMNLISQLEAKQAAENIHDAWGIMNDDEEQIYGVFRSLTSKEQVSQVAEAYNKAFNKDLAGDLMSRLSKAELKVIYDITDAL